MAETVKLSPPWITYYRELQELFVYDSEISLEFDEDNKTIKLYVDNTDKAGALMKLLKPYQEFGNVKVNIDVCPANMEEKTPIDLMRIAFKGNDACSQVRTIKDRFGNKFNYVAFTNKVVQFFNDDMSDLHGNKSMLYEDIAENVFDEHPGVFFCTDTRINRTF